MAETQIRNPALNLGLQHPSAHGVLCLVLEMDGEIIDRADPAHRDSASRHREIHRAQDLPLQDPFAGLRPLTRT